MSPVLTGNEPSVLDLLSLLFGQELKRRYNLRQMPNEDILDKYQIELQLRLHNESSRKDYIALLNKFMAFLGEDRPSADLAKEFIARYSNRSLNTQAKYATIIKNFMKYYGEPVEDLKIKRRTSLPQVVEDEDIEKFLDAVRNKKSHKKKSDRDLLLFELYLKTGMRRNELAGLQVKDVHKDFIMVIKGKGEKDRMITLSPDMAGRLNSYIKHKGPEESAFGLKGTSIGNKVSIFAKKAGVKDIHTHSYRHKYATDLLKKGANIRAVQQLMGHSNLNTTQGYTAITDKDLYEAVSVLSKDEKIDRNNLLANIIEKLNSIKIIVCGKELYSDDCPFAKLRAELIALKKPGRIDYA
jgi:integrase